MKKHNILLIHTDQLRFDCLGYAGNPDVQTPNIDRLAQTGTQYTQQYTVYPICTPSRYSLLSGMYAHQHLVWNNRGSLPSGFETIPSLLKKHYYRTCAVGKMHFNPTYHDIGFDSMILSEQNGKGRYEDDYHRFLMEQGRIDRVDLHDQSDEFREQGRNDYNVDMGAFPSDLPQELHSTHWITEQSLKEISQWDSQGGNFLMVGYIKPHHPFDPPEPYSTMYRPLTLTMLDGYTEAPLPHDEENNGGIIQYNRMSEAKLRQIMALYYGTITQIDDEIGRMLDLLIEKGIYDDTLIVFTSDHGEYLGYHHMLLKCNYLYEPLAKIPLIIKYPQQSAARIDNRLCENIDLAPTLLRLCGITPPDTMEGLDLLDTERSRKAAFCEGQYGTDQNPCIGYMLRDKQYKLILHGAFDKGMLFDLLADPNELTNRFDDPAFREIRSRLTQFLCEKLLFQSPAKSHCDLTGKSLQDEHQLSLQAKEIKQFINRQW